MQTCQDAETGLKRSRRDFPSFTSFGDNRSEDTLRHSLGKAILGDSHFWLPITVLIIGISLLVVLR